MYSGTTLTQYSSSLNSSTKWLFLILNAMSDGATVAGLLGTQVYCGRVPFGTRICRAQVSEKW